MSEQNILNPTPASAFNPDYGFQIEDADEIFFQPRSGSPYIRETDVRGRLYMLTWANRLLADIQSLKNWDRQYRDGFFTYYDIEQGRYFSGRFLGKLKIRGDGFNRYTASATFIELPNLPMYGYPSVWGDPNSVFRGVRDDFGGNRLKLSSALATNTNYALQSEALSLAPWTNSLGGTGTAAVITPDAGTDPNGNMTADQLAFPAVAVGGGNWSIRLQLCPFANALIKSHTFTFSIWMRAAVPLTITMAVQEDGTFENTTTVMNVTTTWTRFSVTKAFSAGATGTNVEIILENTNNQPAKTLFAWGAQLEPGGTVTPYVPTTVIQAIGTYQSKPWDRRTKNYCLQSQSLDQAPWTLSANFVGPSVITADFVADPNGAVTAEKIVFAATGAAQYSGVFQAVALPAYKGQVVTFSIYLYSAGATTISIILEDNASLANTTLNANVTTGWTRFSVTLTLAAGSTATAVNCWVRNPASQAAKTIFVWGAQVEYGPNPSTYTPTTIAAAELAAALPNTPFLERDVAWWNDGTDVSELAEFEYIGYGFRLYAPLNVDQGIMQLSVTRAGATEVAATLIDLYSAAAVNSAVVSTQVNLPLGKHRVTLAATNTKNGASSGKNILFDAIEIMQ
jgi:hypothetical protein